MQDLKLALIQTEIVWHNPEANRNMLEKKISNLSQKADLMVLPEMFTTGFTMEAEANAEPVDGPSLQWMKSMASFTGSVITGSVIVEEDKKYYNRLYWVHPNGNVDTYNKRHLFRMADEEKHYAEGHENKIVEVNGWKVKPLICYDLRFPVWSRNVNLEYDLLLYVANWPQARIDAWDALLKARSIENLCYAAGVNRTGQDGKSIIYNGQSACYNFKGQLLGSKTEKEAIEFVQLSKSELQEYREKFPAYLDSDQFNIL